MFLVILKHKALMFILKHNDSSVHLKRNVRNAFSVYLKQNAS